MHRCIKPGGYVEIQEYEMNLFSDDGSFDNAHWLKKFYAIVHEAAKRAGGLLPLPLGHRSSQLTRGVNSFFFFLKARITQSCRP